MALKFNIKASSPRDKIATFLRMASAAIPNGYLTPKEIEVLTEALMLEDNKFRYNRFSRHGKLKIIENVHMFHGRDISAVSLNGALYELIKKGFIKRDEDSVMYIQKTLENIALEFIRGASDILISFSNDKKEG